jgi:hypothetical protein
MLSPRNRIDVITIDPEMAVWADTLFEHADAEFNSREDIHRTFESVKDDPVQSIFLFQHELLHMVHRSKEYQWDETVIRAVSYRLQQIWMATS